MFSVSFPENFFSFFNFCSEKFNSRFLVKVSIQLPAAFSVDAIDTVAAGDCFNGALAASLVGGDRLRNAVLFAMAAAALSVTKAGASESVPSLGEVQDFLGKL